MTATPHTQTANDVLMGGGGAPTAKITEGVTLAGRILSISEPYQEREYDPNNPGNGAPKFFKSGTPIMSFWVDVATQLRDPSIEDDDGTRRIYMDGARIKKAVRAGVQAAGATGLNVGGTLSVTCTHYDVPGDMRSGKNYAVTYQPGSPANNVLMGAEPDQGNPSLAPGWAPQQPAYQAPAPQAPVYQQPAPAPVTAPVQQTPAPVAAPPVAAGPTPEQVAAVRAAGLDPANVFPGYTAG